MNPSLLREAFILNVLKALSAILALFEPKWTAFSVEKGLLECYNVLC